jgi:outer membrane biosynthesis protein TonB
LQPTSPTLFSLLTRFRVSYPTGSLIAEFLTVHDGSYAVRALVLVGGATLASGMAAHSDIEIAEDQAKVRALEALGMTTVFPPSSSFQPSSLPQWSATIAPSLASPEPPALKAVEQVDKPQVNQPIEEPPHKVEPIQAEIPQPESPEPSPGKDKAVKSKKDKTETEKTEDLAPAIDEPQDRSDEIARIGVEMKRLGWTTIEGRNYLKQRYGKRSRQELNDPELLDFLAYLESQPAPVQT